MRSYNLFRHKGRENLLCAVPEEREVPSFVTGQVWTYSGRIRGRDQGPFGFDPRAAAESVRFNGFYLFADFRDDAAAS
jgi:hypothetical protein